MSGDTSGLTPAHLMAATNDDPLDLLFERLTTALLSADVAKLVLAAAIGDDELEKAIDGVAVERPAPSTVDVAVRPIFLTDIAVEGFRGIAGTARLGLRPGPGLTLIVGRNGSGKSSFAEAAEFALTGTSNRWETKKSTKWRDGWACLHHTGARSIELRLLAEGDNGPTVLRRRWAPEDPLTGGTATAQRPGGKEEPIETLGLSTALATWRPFLSYNELGGLLEDGPSKLYDAISSVLGLDDWTAAEQRLSVAAKSLVQRTRETDTEAKRLRTLAKEIDDPRAQAATAALPVRGAWDLTAVAALCAGEAPNDSDLPVLEAIASLPVIDLDVASAAASAIRKSLEAVAELHGGGADRARLQADLLTQALAVRQDQEETTCPVCATPGVLTAAWVEQAEAEVLRLQGEAAAATRAASALAAATADALTLISPIPAALAAPIAAVPTEPALIAWRHWAEAPPDPTELAAHIEDQAPSLAVEIDRIRGLASAELQRRKDLWQPLAVMLAAWLPGAHKSARQRGIADGLRDAATWLAGEANVVRNERLAPIAAQVIDLWNTMRHNSNVRVESIELTGTRTRRELGIKISVDDVMGAGLPVMSQGELHALALALFLPRATLPQSPFRFVVIDDPVQAMDAARVDGLARNLNQVAKSHQVIVFTHDERLPEACRRLGLGANVLEVNRGERSHVSIRTLTNPAQDYIADARAVMATRDYPEEARRRVIPGLCRHAVEAACVDSARRRLLAAGTAHDDVDTALEDATKLLPKLALALFGDANRTTDVWAHVQRKWGASTKAGLEALNKGSHQLIDERPRAVIDAAERLTNGILTQ